jgi:hypothetical protein
MVIKYRIVWVSLHTGHTGQGRPIFNSYNDAEDVAIRANQEHKNSIFHRVEAVIQEETED